MGRLFAGTPFDRPPRCDRCDRPESECACPPVDTSTPRPDPGSQTAWLRVEARPKGKVVTVVRNLTPHPDALRDLAAALKSACGAGGTIKDGVVELQGSHLDGAERALAKLGYATKRR